jgi:hypothetical protein
MGWNGPGTSVQKVARSDTSTYGVCVRDAWIRPDVRVRSLSDTLELVDHCSGATRRWPGRSVRWQCDLDLRQKGVGE